MIGQANSHWTRASLLLLLGMALPAWSQDKPADELVRADASVTDEDREHWAFQAVKRPAVPETRQTRWVRNEIDAFILHKLERRGWHPAEAASANALLRRISLDLVGLPPTLQQQDLLLSQPSPEAFDTYIDDLLADKGYGERWGRHWLDLVRFAETNGYERDAGKPSVWRFRDYVIRSFNDDKPYDRFVLEQLAGDELDDASTESMIATGFYRLGPWDDEPADFPQDRFDQLDDMLNATSQTFLGITLACARCHDHKFEAYTQHDYYRMIAVLDPLQRPQSGRTDLDSPAGSVAEVAKLNTARAAISSQRKQVHQAYQAGARLLLEKLKAEQIETSLPENVRSLLVKEWGTLTGDEQQRIGGQLAQIVKELSPLMEPVAAETCQQGLKQIEQLRKEMPDLPNGYFYVEPSPQPPITHLLVRGSASSPGPVVQPGVPTVLTRGQPEFLAASERTTRRRLTMARWIARPENPLTARVIVNRIWQHHFGAGIVRTPSDFGVMGTPPTHQQLLDWLTHWFVHDANWSMKKLHRLIMTSNAYRMSTVGNDKYYDEDPENLLLWRKPYVRLEVEAIRDSLLAISGKLDRTMYGPSMYPFVPSEALDGHADKRSIWPAFDEQSANRRTIYAYVKRSLIVPFLEVLDLCDTTRPAPERLVTSVAPQALTMFNGDFVNRQAGYLADRLVSEAGPRPVDQVRLAYRLALSRFPSGQEKRVTLEFLEQETELARRQQDQAGMAPEHVALVQFCRILLNLNEIVYSD